MSSNGTLSSSSGSSPTRLQREAKSTGRCHAQPPLKKARLGYDCDACGTSYTAKRSLVRHFKSGVHCEKVGALIATHQCEFCSLTFSRDDIRQRHEKEVHFLLRRHATRRTLRDSTNLQNACDEGIAIPPFAVIRDSVQSNGDSNFDPAMPINCMPDAIKQCRKGSISDSAYSGSILDSSSCTLSCDDQAQVEEKLFPYAINDSAVDMSWMPGNDGNDGEIQRIDYLRQVDRVDDENGSIRSVSTTSTLKSQSRLSTRLSPSSLIRRGASLKFRDAKDPLLCALCHNYIGTTTTDIRLHINEHAKEYSGSQHSCRICQIGFTHKNDLIHHRMSAALGHCGFDFEHTEPCKGHHPPEAFEDILTDNDRLQFRSRLQHWEQAQLKAYLDQINDIIRLNSLSCRRGRWSIGALLNSFESLTSLMGDVRLSSDPDPSDYQGRIHGSKRRIRDRFRGVKSTYNSMSDTVRFAGQRSVRKLSEQEKLRQLVRVSMSGDMRRAEVLLWADADVNGSIEINDSLSAQQLMLTPAIAAAWKGHTSILKALIERGADVNFQCHDAAGAMHRTALFAAAAQGHLDAAQLLLASGARIDLEELGEHGNALSCATKAGHLEIVRTLLEHGADANSGDVSSGSPLGLAMHTGNTDIAEHLLRGGARVDLQVCEHGTPLECASISGDLDLVRLLVRYGAMDVQRSALEYAAANGRIDVFELLARDSHENSTAQSDPKHLLAQACFWARESTVRLLLVGAVDLNLYNDERHSNLAWAILGHNATIIRCLLEHGAQLRSKDDLRLILFRTTDIWRTHTAMGEDSYATFEACITAVTVCKTLCAVMENIESSTDASNMHIFALAMGTFQRLVVWMREILVTMAGDFDLMDQAESQQNLILCFETLTYLEIRARSHLSRHLGHHSKPHGDNAPMIRGLEPCVIQPTRLPRGYR